jgi:OOP family OmpA-OmpF porin
MYARKLKPVFATLMVAGSLVGISAHAAGPYAGGSLGTQSYPNTLNGNPTSGSALSGKLYGGYQLNQNFAVEAGVTELGAVNNAAGQTDSYGTFVDAVGILPLSPQWSLLGRAGVAHMAVNTPTGNDGGNGLKVGLGAEYALTKAVAVRGEWERYEVVGFGNRPSADQFTVGLKVGF